MFWAIKQAIRIAPGLLISLIGVSVIEGFAPVILVVVTKNLVDATLMQFAQGLGDLGQIIPWIIAFFLVSLLTFEVMYRIRSPLFMRFRQKIEVHLGGDRLCLAASLPLETIEQSETNDLLKRSDQSGAKLEQLLNHVLWMLQHGLQIITISLFFSAISPWIPPLLILSQIPALFLAGKAQQLWLDMTYSQTEKQRKAEYLDTLLTGRKEQKEVRLFGLKEELGKRWQQQRSEIRQESIKLQKKIIMLQFPSSWVAFLSTTAIILYAAKMLPGQALSIGLFVAVFQAANNFFSACEQFVYGLRESLQGAGEIGFVRDFFTLESRVCGHQKDTDQGKPFPVPLQKGIHLDEVEFAYPGREPILKGVSLRIHPGEHIALVGANGAGKSTLAKILMGLYTPTGGKVMADHTNYASIDPELFRDELSAVFQDYYNFEFTLGQSIAVGDPKRVMKGWTTDEAAVSQAAQAGGIYNILSNNSWDWNQPVGYILDQGVGLSGGQWQRIALSRALLRNPQVLILDEPSAALDPIAEAELYAQFLGLMSHRAVFMISHRLGSARLADRVLVLKDGIIVEDGSHEQLLEAQGEYARMWEEQTQWYLSSAQ